MATKICTLSRTAFKELEELIAAVAVARYALMDRIERVADEWRDAFADRSDRWQESDAAAEAQDRIDALDAWREQLDSLDGLEIPEEVK